MTCCESFFALFIFRELIHFDSCWFILFIFSLLLTSFNCLHLAYIVTMCNMNQTRPAKLDWISQWILGVESEAVPAEVPKRSPLGKSWHLATGEGVKDKHPCAGHSEIAICSSMATLTTITTTTIIVTAITTTPTTTATTTSTTITTMCTLIGGKEVTCCFVDIVGDWSRARKCVRRFFKFLHDASCVFSILFHRCFVCVCSCLVVVVAIVAVWVAESVQVL